MITKQPKTLTAFDKTVFWAVISFEILIILCLAIALIVLRKSGSRGVKVMDDFQSQLDQIKKREA